MAKIFITGDSPIAARYMAYVSVDGGAEVAIKYREQPLVLEAENGVHTFAVTTVGRAQRRLMSASDGGTVDRLSCGLIASQNDSWAGNVKLGEGDVLFVYVQWGAKNHIHLRVIAESELEQFRQSFSVELARQNSRRFKRKLIILAVAIPIAIFGIRLLVKQDLFGGAAESIYSSGGQGYTTSAEPDDTETETTDEPEQTETTETEAPVATERRIMLACENFAPLYASPSDAEPFYYIDDAYAPPVCTVTAEEGDWLFVSYTDFRRHEAYEGWVPRSYEREYEKYLPYVASDSELTDESAEWLLELYIYADAFPYYIFDSCEMLRYDDGSPIIFDDGSVAAYSYTVDGIGTMEDYYGFVGGFLSGEALENVRRHYDEWGIDGIETDTGRLRFSPNYAMGFYAPSFESLERLDDGSYYIHVSSDSPSESETVEYKLLVVEENGRYKIAGAV